MPIRRAAGTPPQETPPKNPPAGEPDASSEESASTGEEQESEAPAAAAPPAEGEANAESEKAQSTAEQGDKEKEPAEEPKKEEKDVVKEKGKKVKRTIPAWATMSANQLARSQKKSHLSLYIRPKIDEILTEAIQACFQKTGASAFAVRKYILKKYPSLELDRRGYLLKQALKRVLQRGAIKQVKGKGFSGSFTVVNNSKRSRKRGSTSLEPTEKLGDALPLIFTRLCEPKEASYRLIKKYVEQYFPKLKVDSRPQMLKNALQKAVEKGQLEQLTGKGASGTFQLKRAGDKPLLSGAGLEQAILCAITAMNEPKTCSTTALKRFILENSQGGKVSLQVNNLKRTLRRCEMIGWMEQISGKGFNGSYQLCFPYYPSPATLFPDKHKEEEKEKEEKKMKVKVEEDSSEEEESEEEEDESSEEETSDSEDEPPPPKKR
ncbi:HP1B3 protein, partial [Amia calva]|nr:HP1B3 protein [Amia calva]